MTLIELKYLVALAHERHFGRAAAACFVSQPTLSVAIKKLEEELNVQLFERDTQEIKVTVIGQQIITQAQRVLMEVQEIRELAQQGRDPLHGLLRIGLIFTIAPYILPAWVPCISAVAPHMPLILHENFTDKLLSQLRQGELDCIVLAEPFDSTGLLVKPLYEESFVLAISPQHPWAKRTEVDITELQEQTVLLLGPGHCLRNQILAACPNLTGFTVMENGLQKTFEGSSIETICYMVASGLGITVLPESAVATLKYGVSLSYIPFSIPQPSRRVVLATRRSFNRHAALEILLTTLKQCTLPGIRQITEG